MEGEAQQHRLKRENQRKLKEKINEFSKSKAQITIPTKPTNDDDVLKSQNRLMSASGSSEANIDD